ncbi:MAG: IPT/TIG domain-containing protein [Spirochaetales bacterium]|nr:IPT/TIG domain-containing protein [Spirochaetales bacterium]
MKKSLAFILFLVIFIVCITAAYSQTYGDANNNGVVDIVDALLIAQYYVGFELTNINTSVMDVNGDNSIDIVDALLIAQFYVGMINEFPIENPHPTPNATSVPTTKPEGDTIIDVTIIDAETGTPLAGVRVEAVGADDYGMPTTFIGYTDSNGHYYNVIHGIIIELIGFRLDGYQHLSIRGETTGTYELTKLTPPFHLTIDSSFAYLIEVNPPVPEGGFEEPTTVLITAHNEINPDGSGYYFVRWEGDVTSTAPNAGFIITRDYVITPVYEWRGPLPKPVITSISPSTGPIGTSVTLTGYNFQAKDNIVLFGPGGDSIYQTQTSRYSSDGKTIVFIVYNSIVPKCRYEEPMCTVPAIETTPGIYEIAVTNGVHTSNIVMFEVIGPDATPMVTASGQTSFPAETPYPTPMVTASGQTSSPAETPDPTPMVTASGQTSFPTETLFPTAGPPTDEPTEPPPTQYPPEPTPDPTDTPTPSPTPLPITFELSVDNDYHVYRTGPLDADVDFVVMENGEQKLARKGSYSLELGQLEYISGYNYSCWLRSYSDGQYYPVSNTIEFTYDETFNFQLSVDSNYLLHRSGKIGDTVNWVIEKDGTIVLERNAANEFEYIYHENTPESYFRVWLEQYFSGEYRRVSNFSDYRAGIPINYTISLDQSHRAIRNGYTGIPVYWTVSKNGNLLNTYLFNDSLQCIEYDHEQDQSYAIWLETESGELLSNTLYYYVDDILPSFTLSIADDGTLTRDDAVSESNLMWVIEKNGFVVMQANANDSLSYNYFDSFEYEPDAAYRMWLVQFIDGRYQRISGIVFY